MIEQQQECAITYHTVTLGDMTREGDTLAEIMVPAVAQGEQEFAGVRCIEWFAQDIAIEQDGGSGGNHDASLSCGRCMYSQRFLFSQPLGQSLHGAGVPGLQSILVNGRDGGFIGKAEQGEQLPPSWRGGGKQ